MTDTTDDNTQVGTGYDSQTGRYRTRYDVTAALSTEIVLAVSAVVGREPTDLPPLARTIDPDALDALFPEGESQRGTAEVSFTYANCVVTATADGWVSIMPLDGLTALAFPPR